MKRGKRRLAPGTRKALRVMAENRDRDARMTAGLRDFGALYGLQSDEPRALRRLERMAHEHEQQADAHRTAAALLREVVVAVHGLTLRPPRTGPEGT